MNIFALSAGGIWESIAEWYKGSLIYELLNYFEEKYFSISLYGYQNFSVSRSTGTNIRNIILAVAIGIIIAGAMMTHTKSCHGSFVRKLLKSDCTSPEKAKTLAELGFFRNLSIRRELKKGVTLCKLVHCREQEEFLANRSSMHETSVDDQPESEEAMPKSRSKAAKALQKIKEFWIPRKDKSNTFEVDCSTMHFYIPEELRYRADVRYEKKGSGWLPFIIVSIATVVASAVLCVFLPELFQFADGLITFFSPK